jgi:asparagine synthase (glutamine-hydrolysing)
MCGIAGYIGTRRPTDAQVAACLDSLRHRGPDGSGVYRHVAPDGRHVCLLHTRLSIIDLDERSAQPMRRDTAALVFNGEIYNYLEVRRELAKDGTRFGTQSDTEVLLAALCRDGTGALDRLEGMWALAWYDEATGALLLSRDRFGEKPLLLHETPDGLYFASEAKAIAVLAGRSLVPDLHQLRRHLALGYRALYKTPRTYFLGLRELGSGQVLAVGPGQAARADRYWTPSPRIEPDMSFAEAVAGARQRLLRSMEIRLRADVPLAFCQSGGVDSCSLLSMAKRVFGYDVHGFTVVNADERYDEWDLVARTVRELGIRHTAIPVETGNFLCNLRRIVRSHDAPPCTISYYAHWLLIRSVAANGYKISISGTAADELFSGYYDHHAMYLAEVYGTPDFEPALANWEAHIRPIVRNPLLQDPLAFVKNPNQRDHLFDRSDRYAALLREPFHEAFREERYTGGLLRNRMLNELFVETIPPPLREDDLNAMHFSVENRSPYLDRDLFDFCNAIPTRHLIGDGYNKKVLREAMRGITPDCVLDERRKVGFNAPLFDFLDVADPAVRAELLADGPIFDLVDRPGVARMLEPGRLSNADSKFLFSFVAAKLFLEEFAGAPGRP